MTEDNKTMRYLVINYHRWADVKYYDLDGQTTMAENNTIFRQDKETMENCDGFCPVFSCLETAKKHFPHSPIWEILITGIKSGASHYNPGEKPND
jgi:hypothetical protein